MLFLQGLIGVFCTRIKERHLKQAIYLAIVLKVSIYLYYNYTLGLAL